MELQKKRSTVKIPRGMNRLLAGTATILFLVAVFAFSYLGLRTVPAHPEPTAPGETKEPSSPGPVPSSPSQAIPAPWSWPEPPAIPRPEVVKGIYVPALYAGGPEIGHYLNLVARTELNAVVIDTKDDRGRLAYSRTIVPWAEDPAGLPAGTGRPGTGSRGTGPGTPGPDQEAFSGVPEYRKKDVIPDIPGQQRLSYDYFRWGWALRNPVELEEVRDDVHVRTIY